MKTLLLFAVLVAAIFTISAAAQTTEPVLVKLPKAVNPADGYLGGGDVQVRVAVNEQGDVTDAEFVSGPRAVCGWVTRPDVVKTREAGVAVARKAKFAPAMKDGRPSASSTIISVQFPLPKSNDEPLGVIGSDRDIATGETVFGVANESAAAGAFTGKAIALPQPKYPAAARAVRASGAVQIQVLIDKSGNVFLAQAAGGHPLLQSAAVEAACSAKFKPVLVSGEPVKVSGILTYNFVL